MLNKLDAKKLMFYRHGRVFRWWGLKGLWFRFGLWLLGDTKKSLPTILELGEAEKAWTAAAITPHTTVEVKNWSASYRPPEESAEIGGKGIRNETP